MEFLIYENISLMWISTFARFSLVGKRIKRDIIQRKRRTHNEFLLFILEFLICENISLMWISTFTRFSLVGKTPSLYCGILLSCNLFKRGFTVLVHLSETIGFKTKFWYIFLDVFFKSKLKMLKLEINDFVGISIIQYIFQNIY